VTRAKSNSSFESSLIELARLELSSFDLSRAIVDPSRRRIRYSTTDRYLPFDVSHVDPTRCRASLRRRAVFVTGSRIAGDEIAHIKERETLDNSTEQGEKINSTTTPMGWRADVARRDRGGTSGKGRGWGRERRPGDGESPGGPPRLTPSETALRFPPCVLNEHTGGSVLARD